MKVYIVYNDNAYTLYKNNQYKIGPTKECDIHIKELLEVKTVVVKETTVLINKKEYTAGKYKIDKEITLIIFEVETIHFIDKNNIFIGNESRFDIYIKELISNIFIDYSDKVKLVSDDEFYLNGKKQEKKSIIKNYDDLLFLEGINIVVLDKLISISSIYPIQTTLRSIEKYKEEDKVSEFHRSPRIILREPTDKIVVGSPPTEQDPTRQSLVRLLMMPVAMIFFTILMYIYSSSGAMMIMMFGMSFVTIITSIHGYVADKKKFKEQEIKKVVDYKQYLQEKYIELTNHIEEQKNSLIYHYPEMTDILEMPVVVNRRIYEKTPYYFDFLTYKLGKGEVEPSFSVEYSKSETTKIKAEVEEDIKGLLSYYKSIKNVPIKNDISVPMGYIGTRRIVIEQIQQLLIQTAVFQSYHDVQFMVVFREEEKTLWEWSKWLPHMKIKAFNSRGLIYNQRTRDQLLTSLYQLIKERKLSKEQYTDKSREKVYLPHYIIIITDLELLLGHNIMEYLYEDLTSLGVSFIFVEEVIESLPEHVKTVVDYRSEKKATLILQRGEYVNKTFEPLEKISEEAKEKFSRCLAGINHSEMLKNSIPNSVTFLEMYGVKTIEELNIVSRWNQNETYQSMAVPLGVRGRDDILYLNLHEKAHGPHGLIAGTTGSGKSELVQSYILSLAVNYHPYEIAFLLIDYKGGGMANLFAKLPHLVGTITNLDANQANRALVSIKAELKKRQRIFAEYDVNHINQYTKLFKEGVAKDPLPHLFIISDEFAELKQEQPDFMQELVSTARIGRSLGIHLILATQKPSGVVNDQIWSNSKFKIALKVQDVADSKEIIKTPDAAQITQAGRAYLQVGNNEIYELFQSAWSGAEYSTDGFVEKIKDKTIYEILENGQYNPINKDLSGLSNIRDVKSCPTQLESIVEETESIFEKTKLPKVASPWLPPLEENVYSVDLQDINFENYWSENREKSLLVGYQDIPEKQEQSCLYFDMEERGHVLLVGSPGYGKSTFLQTFAIDAMRKNTPEELHMYLYDFGTSGLISLIDFPHIADYFSTEDEKKIFKSLRRLKKEIKERKKMLSEERAANLSQYNQITNKKVPYIYILVDGYEGIVERAYEVKMEEALNTISREGASLGIYLVATLSRVNAMKLQLLSNFKTKISLYLFDKGDLSNIIGHSNMYLEDIKGRGIGKFDEIVHFQIVQPYKSLEYTDYIAKIKEEVEKMRTYWKGELPEPIPMLPKKVTISHVDKFKIDNNDFILGLYDESVEIAKFNLTKSMLLTSDNALSVEKYYKLLDYNINRYNDEYTSILLDPTEKVGVSQLSNVQYCTDILEVKDALNSIIHDLKRRMKAPEVNYSKWLVIIPDMVAVYRNSSVSEQDFKLFIREGAKYGITPIFIGYHQDLVANYDVIAKLTKQLVEQVYIGMRITDQAHTPYAFVANEPYVKIQEGYIFKSTGYEAVQILEV